MKGGPVEVSGGADSDAVDRLGAALKKLRKEFEQHCQETTGKFNNIEKILPTKADKSELLEMQNTILNKVTAMIEQLLGQFAMKEDVHKRFSQLSKKIRELFDLMSRNQTQVDDSAMFSKKYVGPASCASCEKNITNLEGQRADYHVWKNLPFKDPNERIARFGPGFSKILSQMQPGNHMHMGSSPTTLRTVMHHHVSSVDDTNVDYNTDGVGEGADKSKTHEAFYPRHGRKANSNMRNPSSTKHSTLDAATR